MHTTVYEGVSDNHVTEYREITRKLQAAFKVTADELDRLLHAQGLFIACGSPERPYDVGIRRLPRTLMQRRLANGG